MDTAKKLKFIEKHSKKRTSFAKGGLIKGMGDRKHFDSGGTVNNSVGANNGFLGGIGDILGLNNNFVAGSGEINPGTNNNQLSNSYIGTQGALGNQGQLTGELLPQVPSAVQNQNSVAQSELGMLNGTGPNPALAQLAQTTGQNVAQTTAEMAGQRGASANAGLIARQAAQQGAGIQQQGAGQASTLANQQQIQAQQNLANLSNNQISQTGQAVTNQNQAQQNEQGILQNANTSTNNAAVGMQSNINNVNAQTAAANQNQASNIFGGISSLVSGALGFAGGMAHGGEVEDHLKLAEMNAHSMNHAKRFADGGGVGSPNLGSGNYVPMAQSGGPNIQATSALPANNESFAKDLKGMGKKKPTDAGTTEPMPALDPNGAVTPGEQLAGGPMDSMGTLSTTGGSMPALPEIAEAAPLVMAAAHGGKICQGPYDSHVANYLAGGGIVKADVSAGEIYLTPEQVRKVIHEDVDPAKIGKKFPGKAKVKGDSFKNDTIPADLEEGGVVIDRKNMGTKEKRQLFVHKALARKKARA